MAPLGQTIAVIDKSGKVVSTSKQLLGVFSNAKNAYRERKSTFQSERNAKIAEQQALQGLANYQIDDSPSVAPSRRSRGTRSRHHSGRSHRASSHYDDEQTVVSRRDSHYDPPQTLARRHTHHDVSVRDARPSTARSRSDAHIDMDLAYGDASHAALSRYTPPEPKDDQQQLNTLVNRAQWLLEEAHCVQHGATATIAHLQKNPDAMAAVALTLAEISNLGRQMAPAALTAVKSAAPAVFALLSSPQFLIAAGVGLGATVVMFGGYKIIQRIKGDTTGEGKPAETELEMEEMMEFNTEALSSVEMWRRGVANEQAHSVGTSVDGEFITPTAAAMSGIDVTTARAQRDPRFKFEEDASVASSRRSRRSRTTRAPTHAPSERHERRSKAPSEAPSGFFGRSSSRSKAPSKAPSGAPSRAPSRAPSHAPSRTPSHAPSRTPSHAPSRTPSHAPSYAPSRTPSKHGTYVSETEKRPKEKKKGPSRLRLMFTSSS
ncbi:unnamed protein product [Penicillium nalgiovense]|uniref:Uncharacterized protein n=1 Tax=Penicillium nalgiovense TaxID=60175 RepID=A0A1V6YC92_PENNA|nr:hypothetical protein PENNAL_c0025G05792 [Penicillium nalgiovense]CAG7994288.1 unnamed protein product [Penicillium nalgiovense]CAG8007808.1 unnamed protein product [Penicillium nalgiovense]CAG8054103.1 unnamed protein product [Penicillium nalgiovense]CAG8054319.1 unnamed protein product [Penicillium nalgiovense]